MDWMGLLLCRAGRGEGSMSTVCSASALPCPQTRAIGGPRRCARLLLGAVGTTSCLQLSERVFRAVFISSQSVHSVLCVGLSLRCKRLKDGAASHGATAPTLPRGTQTRRQVALTYYQAGLEVRLNFGESQSAPDSHIISLSTH